MFSSSFSVVAQEGGNGVCKSIFRHFEQCLKIGLQLSSMCRSCNDGGCVKCLSLLQCRSRVSRWILQDLMIEDNEILLK